ncbi:hypothetical protein CUMW_237230, partial [Citrus unshiu]
HFTGCFVSLFCAYAILAHLSGIFSANTEAAYMEIVLMVDFFMADQLTGQFQLNLPIVKLQVLTHP